MLHQTPARPGFLGAHAGTNAAQRRPTMVKKDDEDADEKRNLWADATTRGLQWDKVRTRTMQPIVVCRDVEMMNVTAIALEIARCAFLRGTLVSHWQSDLLTVVYWFRQLFSVGAGLVCGLAPFRGAVALLGCVRCLPTFNVAFPGGVSPGSAAFANLGDGRFVVLNAACPFLYYSKFLGVNEDDIDGSDANSRMELLQEGFIASASCFLVRIATQCNVVCRAQCNTPTALQPSTPCLQNAQRVQRVQILLVAFGLVITGAHACCRAVVRRTESTWGPLGFSVVRVCR